MENEEVKEKGSFGWAVLGFFFPLIGLILYLVWMKDRKGDSKMAGIGALVSVISSIVISIILGIVFYLVIWPSVQNDIADQTCETYGESYKAMQEGDNWYCIDSKTGKKVIIDDEEVKDDKSEEKPKSDKVVESDEEDEEYEEDDETQKVTEGFHYGIQMNGYTIFKENELIFSKIDNDFEYKIDTTNGNKIIWYYKKGKKNTVTAENAKEIKSVRVASSCEGDANLYFYYINENNELYEIPGELCDSCEGERKLASNVAALAYTDVDDMNGLGAESCGRNTIIAKDTNNILHLATPYEELTTRTAKTITNTSLEGEQNGVLLLYIVNEYTKANNYLTDDKGNKMIAQTVIVPEESVFREKVDGEYNIYVIDENNIIYVFNNYLKNTKGKKYNSNKVKSFTMVKGGLEITYEDGKTETIKGTVYTK